MKKNAKNSWTTFGMGIGVLCLLNFSSCGVAENPDEVDTPTTGAEEGAKIDDRLLEANEFFEAFNANTLFDDWDLNDDDVLDENEFNASHYDVWDQDNDGILEENEWKEDINHFGLAGENWDAWDANHDNQVGKNEFNSALDEDHYFSTWDADKNNQLTEREYTDGIFGLWDDNDDGMLEKEKYEGYYRTYFGA
ncbi:MAG: hypothetical protein ICV83_15400 [Cytophagales bacterium]|nr:hypothetical protein [Cytophagales bacterium]